MSLPTRTRLRTEILVFVAVVVLFVAVGVAGLAWWISGLMKL
ncbi:MAG: hypothetical protein ABL997_15300 [Planctomycetota bacterium]